MFRYLVNLFGSCSSCPFYHHRMMNTLEIFSSGTAGSSSKKRAAGDMNNFRNYFDCLHDSLKEVNAEKLVLMELLKKKELEIEALMNVVYTQQRVIDDLLEKTSQMDARGQKKLTKLKRYYGDRLENIREGLLECAEIVGIVRDNGARKGKWNKDAGEGTSRPAGNAANNNGLIINLDEEEPIEEDEMNLVGRYLVELEAANLQNVGLGVSNAEVGGAFGYRTGNTAGP